MNKQIIFCYKNYVPINEIIGSLLGFLAILFGLFTGISILVTDIHAWLFVLLIILFCFLVACMSGVVPWLYPRQPEILLEIDGISIKYRSVWHKLLWKEIQISQSGVLWYRLYGIKPKLVVYSRKLPFAYTYDKQLIRRRFWITQDIQNYAILEEYLFRGVADGYLTNLE